MENNVYQAPNADLAGDESTARQSFYVVSIQKFTVLFFVTLGLYSIYWFYQNWTLYKKKSGLSLWPVPRAIFNIFFTHSLVAKVQMQISDDGKEYKWQPDALATGYVVFTIISNILDRLSYREIGSPYTDLFSLLVLPIVYIFLMPMQKAINFSQDDASGSSNNHYTAANTIWIAIGSIFWVLVLVGLADYYFGFLEGY